MKGQTNATERAVTVKTGVTVDMMMNIPEDVPWDLVYKDTFIHGIGPVTSTMTPIIGTRDHSSPAAMRMIYRIRSYSTKLSVTYANITGSSVSINNFFDISETDLASAKLYLYGGGEPDLVSLMAVAPMGVTA